MLERTTPATPRRFPLRPLRLLIEDPKLAVAARVPSTSLFATTICSGPQGEHEVCPLVMDGRCPYGPADVVVGALDGPWAPSVRAAWAQTGVPFVDGATTTLADDADDEARMAHHVGAAVRALLPPYLAGDEPAAIIAVP